jgi:hypothetical protein
VDVDLSSKLANLLEQPDRLDIITKASKDLAGRRMLGIVANGRLEAVCVWKILTGTGGKDSEQDANYWHQGWKGALYIPEFASAPWNVGWPTNESGVSGAGAALVKALKEKGKAEKCDGIGLVGLKCNLAFYLKMGFQRRFTEGCAVWMDLRT